MPAFDLRLDRSDLELIAEALDSHLYWQLAPEDRRNDGYVLEPYTEEEQTVVDLEARIQTLLRSGLMPDA